MVAWVCSLGELSAYPPWRRRYFAEQRDNMNHYTELCQAEVTRAFGLGILGAFGALGQHYLDPRQL